VTLGLYLSRLWGKEEQLHLVTGVAWEDAWLREYGVGMAHFQRWFGGRMRLASHPGYKDDFEASLYLLGQTHGSVVYLAYNRGQFWAVKENSKPGEFELLSRLRHCHIVRADCEFTNSRGTRCLVMEPLVGGCLGTHLRRLGRFEERVCKLYFLQLLAAISHIHEQGLVYRDLKLENIVLDSGGDLKLVDFGLCSPYSPGNKFCGSLPYIAPETITQRQTTCNSDIYALGIVLFEMATGVSPYRGSEDEVIEQKLRFDPELPGFVSPGLRGLVSKLTHRKPFRRPLPAHILLDPWLAGLTPKSLEHLKLRPSPI
jgi:serine/threonine protein kinase